MKRMLYFILIAFMVTAISSCSKGDKGDGPDDNAPEYYVSFKANGSQIEYKGFSVARLGYSADAKLYNGVIQGYSNYMVSDKDRFSIIIFDNSPVAVNTYQDPQKAIDNEGNKFPKVILTYLDNTGNVYSSAGLLVDENGHMPSFPGAEDIVADAKVSVTKLTSTYIEGTFSGTTYLNTDASYKTKIVISEGKFALNRSQ